MLTTHKYNFLFALPPPPPFLHLLSLSVASVWPCAASHPPGPQPPPLSSPMAPGMGAATTERCPISFVHAGSLPSVLAPSTVLSAVYPELLPWVNSRQYSGGLCYLV